MDFYPSISEKLLDEALAWASDLTTITENDISIIKHARKSLLFGNGKLWTKKDGSNSLFDVTMGSFDGAEICELIGLFILNHLGKRFGKENIGLYRDDGLAIIKSKSARLEDKTRKDLYTKFNFRRSKVERCKFSRCYFRPDQRKTQTIQETQCRSIVHQQTLKPSSKHYKTITYGYQQMHCTSLIGRTNI